jgi:nicotinate phosphoribosyltransferase
VAKKSVDKVSIGGRKYALRRRNSAGVAEAEVVGIGTPAVDDGDDRELLVPLVRDGEVVGRESLDAARERHVAARAELPPAAQQMSRGEPVIPTLFEPDDAR